MCTPTILRDVKLYTLIMWRTVCLAWSHRTVRAEPSSPSSCESVRKAENMVAALRKSRLQLSSRAAGNEARLTDTGFLVNGNDLSARGWEWTCAPGKRSGWLKPFCVNLRASQSPSVTTCGGFGITRTLRFERYYLNVDFVNACNGANYNLHILFIFEGKSVSF